MYILNKSLYNGGVNCFFFGICRLHANVYIKSISKSLQKFQSKITFNNLSNPR